MTKEEVAKLKGQGNDAFKNKDHAGAIEFYTQAIDLSEDPKSEILFSNRAACHAALGQWDQCLSDAEACIKIKDSFVKGHFRRGLALYHLNRYDVAMDALRKAAALEPANPGIEAKLKETETALTRPIESVTVPSEAKATGNFWFKQGDIDKAIAWYGQAIKCSPTETPEVALFYSNRALCHQQRQAYQETIADCAEAIRIDEKCVKAYLRRAMAFEALERYSKATDDYKKALEMEPGTMQASQGYSRCLKAAKDLGLM